MFYFIFSLSLHFRPIVYPCTFYFILFDKKNQSSIVGAKGLGFGDRELGVGGLGLRV
jgi:hypothetical protein